MAKAARRKWQLTGVKRTRLGHTYWKHATTGLWWSKDTAGHGGSVFKVHKEDGKGDLIWYRDADEFGDFISPAKKHKGPVGRRIILFGEGFDL
jgi:hypothetical protein